MLLDFVQDAVAQTFDIEFTASGSAQYLAIAFGTQPDMVDADMYYCTQNQFFSGVITTSQVAPPPATEITGNSNAVSFYCCVFVLLLVNNAISKKKEGGKLFQNFGGLISKSVLKSQTSNSKYSDLAMLDPLCLKKL